MKSLERMEKIAPAHIDSPFSFEFPVADKVSSPLLSIRHGRAGHGETVILEGINLSLLPGSRIGLLGPNGAGKSTLMDALLGQGEQGAASTLISGERTCGENLAIGYFAQHQLDLWILMPARFCTCSGCRQELRSKASVIFWAGLISMVMRR